MKRLYIISHGGIARDWTYTLDEALTSPALPRDLVWEQVAPERWTARHGRSRGTYEIARAEVRDVEWGRVWVVSA